jgi:hypothetical protein
MGEILDMVKSLIYWYLILHFNQNSTHDVGLKVFSSLPTYIKNRQHDVSESEQRLINFLNCNTFYILEEHFYYNETQLPK